MYNHNINTLEEVKEDVKNVFTDYNLTPSDTTNSFTFKNYTRKNNFSNRVVYSGNSSFFLEPLEATSMNVMNMIQRTAFDVWAYGMPIEAANDTYTQYLKEVETMIMMHYYAGSKFDTPFWEFAKARGEKCLSTKTNDTNFKTMIELSKLSLAQIRESSYADIGYGGLTGQSYKQNLVGLNLYDKLDTLLKANICD
jgi:tryptophan halogenase